MENLIRGSSLVMKCHSEMTLHYLPDLVKGLFCLALDWGLGTGLYSRDKSSFREIAFSTKTSNFLFPGFFAIVLCNPPFLLRDPTNRPKA